VVESVAHTLLVDHRDRRLPRRAGDPIAVWIDGAIRRRQKILYELEPTESRDEVMAALIPAAAEQHQVEVLEPAAVQAESSGTAEGLALLHRSHVDEAHAGGWSGLAVVTGPTVFSAVAADIDEAVMHERSVSRVVAETGMSALCRFRPPQHPQLADAMLGGHFDEVDDAIWSARAVDGVLHLRGEIDVSNTDRVSHVLRAALDAGLREVDLSDLQFLTAGGVRALRSAAASLPAGEALVVGGANVLLQQLFSVVDLSDDPSIELRGELR
jgi:anti-anti-sigma regulatory factor